MLEFFTAQMDYVFLVYGLAFIALATTAYFISRARPAQTFWKWIALFGLTHGITEWLDMLFLSLGDSPWLSTVRTAFLIVSFLCFIEVVRLDAQKRWGKKLFGVWGYGPLLCVTLGTGWMLGGGPGINILSRYVFGVLGGILTARVILTSSAWKDREDKDRTLSSFAWLLCLYATTQCFVPKGTFPPASLINQEAFFSFAGFPVQFLRLILAAFLAGLAWKEYSRGIFEVETEEATPKHFKKGLLFPVSLAVVLMVGWIVTGVVGRDKEKEESADWLNRVKIAAAMIDPGEVKALSGTPADVPRGAYRRIMNQFLNILQDNPDALYVYLFGQKDGKNIFLIDSELSGRKSSPEPLATPGEVYEEDVEFLRRMFASGGSFTVGPETDKWGTFISSLVAIPDPVSGKIIAILGFDYDAKTWGSSVSRHRLNPILITLLFAVLLIVFFIIFQREQEVRRNVQERESVLQKLMLQLKKEGETLALEIEDRKLLEKVSLENSLFLQKLMDAMPNPIFYKDTGGFYLGCNKAFEAFFGLSQKQVMGKTAKDLFSSEVAKFYREKDEELLALPGIQVYEALVVNASGELRNIVFHKATFNGPSGEVQGIVGVIVDFTLRKKAEELVVASENRFMDLLYASEDAILLIDRDTFVDCNQATARMLGYSTREEFLMKHPSELSPPFQPDGKASFDKANEMMNLAFQHGFHRFDWMHKKANGEIFPVEVSLTPVAVFGKNLLHCLWRDLTEFKKIEGQVRQLSQAIEQSPSCAVITDKEGKIVYVNERFVELTGYSREEALGKNPSILKSGEQASEFYKDLWDTILAGKDWQGQFCNKKKNGELYWELAHIAPLRNEEGEITHFVAVKEDITYRRKIEEQLRHSLRMEAVGRLAGGIAHDFNNMLTVINGYSGYVLGKMQPENPYYDKILQIRDAGDCAATIVRQLLNLSRKEVAKPKLFRVSDATVRMKHMISRLLGDNVELNLDHAEETGFVKMDPGQMEQIFLNLLVNAREAMPTGGVMTVSTDLVRIEEIHEELLPLRKRAGNFIRITVKDTGAGIDPSIRARIFEPFFTTKKRGMNTGLGLSIVYGIVEQAGGAISLESQMGKGSTFRVYLPQAQESNDPKTEVRMEELPQGKGKILLVEDEAQVREFTLHVLRERGYDVRVARGGAEALVMIEEDPGRKYDLLLTDLTMPKMNGKELVIRIREKIPGLKVIFVSGYSEHAVGEVADSVFLQKPFSHRALVMKVWDILGR